MEKQVNLLEKELDKLFKKGYSKTDILLATRRLSATYALASLKNNQMN